MPIPPIHDTVLRKAVEKRLRLAHAYLEDDNIHPFDGIRAAKNYIVDAMDWAGLETDNLPDSVEPEIEKNRREDGVEDPK